MKMKSIFLILITFTITSYSNAQPLEYGYIFHETTGITYHILKDGKEIKIQFSSDSNQRALKLLTSLKWNVLYPNSKGDKIFLKGVLRKEINKTPHGPDRAQSEDFQYFKLISWYIKTPFMETKVKDEGMLPQEFIFIKRANLKKTDFENMGNMVLDLSELQN